MNFSEARMLFFMQMVVLMKTKGKKNIVATILLTQQMIAYLRKKNFKVLPEMSSGFHYLSDNA